MKNKMNKIALLVLGLGTVMLFGTSYSLITNTLVSDETFGFNVANFDVSFNDNTNISISSIPQDDEDGIKNSAEYTFDVKNNGDYDINYRLDIMENGSYSIKDVIHYVYSVNGGEYSKVLSLKDNATISQNKVLTSKAKDTYKVKLWLSIDADESYMNKSFSANILLTATQNEFKYASHVIEKLGLNKQDEVVYSNGDYRYSKSDAPNYVWFNCKDGFTKGEDYCEKWRIIGSFSNKSEKSNEEFKSLKIVSTNIVNDVTYNNDVKTGNYDESYVETYANGYYYDSLETDTQKLVLKARWSIGEVSSNNLIQAIKEENSEYFYSYIGLVNVSDYIYLQDEIFFPNDKVMLLNKTKGNVNILTKTLISGDNLYNYGFLPCLYLRGDVSIVSGDGTKDEPYELVIKYPLNY